MTSKQFTTALTRLGILQVALADKLKINPRTVRNWVGGRSEVPTTIAVLLNLMLDAGKGLEDLRG